MEYFVFEPQFLSNLARHCESGESLQLDIIQKLNEKNQSIKCNELLHRLFLGELEQHLFSKFDPSGDVSIMTLQRNYAEKFCPNQVQDRAIRPGKTRIMRPEMGLCQAFQDLLP